MSSTTVTPPPLPSAPVAAEPGPRSPAATRRTFIRPRRGWQPVDLRELWRARDLLQIFTLRDITVRYKQTFFGLAWAVVVPVVQVLVFSVFFGRLLGVGQRVDEAVGKPVPYPLFALSGQVIWNFFSTGLTHCSSSLTANVGIIRKVYVPRLVLPISALGKPGLDAAIVAVLLGVMTCCYAAADVGVALSWKLPLAPLVLAGAVLPALGVGLILSAATVHYRDLQYVLPFAIQTLFYLTPVIYPVEILPETATWLLYLNPIAGFVQAHRACVMDLPIDWSGLALSLTLAATLLVIGLFLFARTERQFADVA